VTARGVGSVLRTIGGIAIASLPAARIGDGVLITSPSRRNFAGRVAAVENGRVAVVPFAPLTGIAVGDRVESAPDALECVLGFGLLGRAIDPGGSALDGGASIRGTRAAVTPRPPPPRSAGRSTRSCGPAFVRSMDCFPAGEARVSDFSARRGPARVLCSKASRPARASMPSSSP
jgi:flagellar biosynthesis/type III secretory pathway ATPase